MFLCLKWENLITNNVHEIVDLEMTLVTVSNRDRKLVIWNFMEELCEYYQYAVANKIVEAKLVGWCNPKK